MGPFEGHDDGGVGFRGQVFWAAHPDRNLCELDLRVVSGHLGGQLIAACGKVGPNVSWDPVNYKLEHPVVGFDLDCVDLHFVESATDFSLEAEGSAGLGVCGGSEQ